LTEVEEQPLEAELDVREGTAANEVKAATVAEPVSIFVAQVAVSAV
jgi:hypothetical protein